MKGNVIAQGKVQKVLKDFVFAELWTDRTEWAAENSKLLKQRFRSAALPLYATLSSDGVERSRLLGVATADEFVAFLRKGLDQTGTAPTSVQRALAEGRRVQKPVLLQFTGFTDLNSAYMAGTVLQNASVRQALAGFVVEELPVDSAGSEKGLVEYMKEKLRSLALPLYVTFGPDGSERSRLVGIASEREFLAFLERGRATAK